MSIPVEVRFWSKVDKTEDCWLWTAATRKGHGTFRLDGTLHAAHRIAYEWLVGAIPTGMHIDHICHNRACVNPDHLRVVTPKQNSENRTGAARSSKTGVLGVHWDDSRSRWQAGVQHNRRHHAKRFLDFDQACAWVVAKRLELFTHNDVDKVSA